MLRLRLDQQLGGGSTVLCLGAHCDDIEIGCGATLLQLLDRRSDLHVHWVVFSSNDQRAREAKESATAFIGRAKSMGIVIKAFRNSYFPFVGDQIKDAFEELRKDIDPDLIFTHQGEDLHQDHRLVSQLTWNTFRDHLILEYEIPKYDGDLGRPNVFSPLDEEVCRRKIDIITQCFSSQKHKQWFDAETFLAMLRLRGVEANSPTRYAEAFYCRKLVLA